LTGKKNADFTFAHVLRPRDIYNVLLAIMKTACITGATGQIGSYLSEILLHEGYEVCGLKHSIDTSTPDYMLPFLAQTKWKVVLGDITDAPFMDDFISKHRPDLFINCAAQSNVVASFDSAEYTMKATGDAVITCLDALARYSPSTRFITLGSALMFGNALPPQNETTPFDPQSPYAKAKVLAYNAIRSYRKDGLFACNAICFNSESPRRGTEYVSRKITTNVARIKTGKKKDKLVLGNLQVLRDFSHAQDTANAIYQIITHTRPDDFVIASGQTHSIQEFVELAFARCNLDWREHVEIDLGTFGRGKENTLLGDASKIRNQLNWGPRHTFTDLVNEMVDYDLALAKGEIDE
jgi:GDPmannose 4,6-dehydratase